MYPCRLVYETYSLTLNIFEGQSFGIGEEIYAEFPGVYCTEFVIENIQHVFNTNPNEVYRQYSSVNLFLSKKEDR